MENNEHYYCYSYRLFHFLCSFGEICVSSKVNSRNQKRYWMFKKSKRLDDIISLYNEVKHRIS